MLNIYKLIPILFFFEIYCNVILSRLSFEQKDMNLTDSKIVRNFFKR